MSLPQADTGQLPFIWTRGIAARELFHYLERKQIDAIPILSSAGLSHAQLTQDPGYVSAAAQVRFLELAATAINDPLLGLHVAAEMDLRNIGLLYYLAAACATVADVLEDLKRYAATATDEIQLEIFPQDQETVVNFRRMGSLQ